jgi:hypothetical protein
MDYGTSYEKGLITLKFPATRTEMKNFMKALAACRLQLMACGLKLAAWGSNLFTRNLNACSLRLVACGLLLVARRLSLEACGLKLETGFGNSAARYKGRTNVYRMQHF